MVLDKTFSAEDFSSVKIKDKIVGLNIVGGCKTVRAECSNIPDDVTVEVADGVLNIELPENNMLSRMFRVFYAETLTLYLTDKALESITIDVAACNISLENVNSGSVMIDSDAGNVTAQNVTAKDCFEVRSGAGDIKLTDISGGRLTVDAGAGNIKLKGDIDSLKADCGTGNISFAGTVQDTVSVDSGIGNVDLTFTNKPTNVSAETGIGKPKIKYI